MQFLNDKFFKVAVILFFLLMALPFIFSEDEPEKKDNTPALEFEDKNPVYNIINRIAKFYGFKKEDNNKDFSLNENQISQIKKQIAQKKEDKFKQTNTFAQTENKSEDNTETATTYSDGQKAQIYAQNQNNQGQINNNYINFENPENDILTYPAEAKNTNNKNNFARPAPLPKSDRQNINKTNNLLATNTQNITQTATQTKTLPEENPQKKQNNLQTDNNVQIYSKNGYNSAANKTSKGTLGSFLKPSTQAGKDFLNNIDSSIKNIQFIKQNQTAKNQEQQKNAPSYIKTYKAQVFNTNTNKMQEVAVQKQIAPDSIKTAEEVRKITAENIAPQGYNENFFTYHGKEIAFPEANILAQLPPQAPPHIVVPELASAELNTSFNTVYNKAEQKLSAVPYEKLPSLEFIYKNDHNRIIRAPNDSFNVQAISRVLANKVLLLKQNDDIDFLDIKNCIYVVPEEQLYKEYLSMQIPVIYYPKLSPDNLGKAYDSAKNAIDILISNKEKQLKTEQNQNKAEIENILTTKE